MLGVKGFRVEGLGFGPHEGHLFDYTRFDFTTEDSQAGAFKI